MDERQSLAGGVAEDIKNLIGADRFDQILKNADFDHSYELLETIEELLEPLFVDDYSNRERLRRSRAIFESAVAQDVGTDEVRRNNFKKAIEPIHLEMRRLAAIGCDDAAKTRFWELDGEFHICLGNMAGVRHIRDVVTLIQDRVRRFAFPSNLDDMTATCDEHEDIIHSIVDEFWDDNRIVEAVQRHTKLAFGRWFKDVDVVGKDVESERQSETARCLSEARRRLGQPSRELEEAIVLAIQDTANRVDTLCRCDVEFAFESLMMQHQFPGEYVAFQEFDERGKYAVKIHFHSVLWGDVRRFLQGNNEPIRVEFQPSPVMD